MNESLLKQLWFFTFDCNYAHMYGDQVKTFPIHKLGSQQQGSSFYLIE